MLSAGNVSFSRKRVSVKRRTLKGSASDSTARYNLHVKDISHNKESFNQKYQFNLGWQLLLDSFILFFIETTVNCKSFIVESQAYSDNELGTFQPSC